MCPVTVLGCIFLYVRMKVLSVIDRKCSVGDLKWSVSERKWSVSDRKWTVIAGNGALLICLKLFAGFIHSIRFRSATFVMFYGPALLLLHHYVWPIVCLSLYILIFSPPRTSCSWITLCYLACI